MPPEPPLLVLWERLLGELLDVTAQFPKSARYTFASRIDGLSVDVLTAIARARYAPKVEQARYLTAANDHLAVLRVLLRVSADRRFLAPSALERLSRGIEEAGRMVGGWLRGVRAPEQSAGGVRGGRAHRVNRGGSWNDTPANARVDGPRQGRARQPQRQPRVSSRELRPDTARGGSARRPGVHGSPARATGPDHHLGRQRRCRTCGRSRTSTRRPGMCPGRPSTSEERPACSTC